MSQPLAFIFDMDGTLVDNMAFHTQSWLMFLGEQGITLTEEELHRQTHGTIEEIIRRMFGEHLPEQEVLRLGDRKESLYRQMYQPHLEPIPGLVEFLSTAHGLDIPMALGTSADQPNIDLVLDGLAIAPYFATTVGGHHVTHGKPHPETFLRAAQQMGIGPECCIVFEDTLAGIEAATRAGMRAIALTTTLPASTFAAFPVVQSVITDYTELDPVVLLNAVSAL